MHPEEYRSMIADFLSQRISVSEFERSYLDAFKSQPDDMDETITRVLSTLFTSVDAYSPDCLPGEEGPFSISEHQLRKDALDALQRLDQVKDVSAGRGDPNRR